MRRAIGPGLVVLGLLLPGAAAAGKAEVTLSLEPAIAGYGSLVSFTGAVSPLAAGKTVEIYVKTGDGWLLAATGQTDAKGTYRLAAQARGPAVYVARVKLANGAGRVESPRATLRIRPVLRTRVVGSRVIGGALALTGRLLPAHSGTLSLSTGGAARRVRVSPAGRFKIGLPTRTAGRLHVVLTVRPGAGYEQARRSFVVRLHVPPLSLGSAGAAVRILEKRLAELRYALRRVDSFYGYDTFEAVLAFQKVRGMARTGRVGRDVWRALGRASTPRPAIPRGDHIEVSKTRQVLYEVRRGRVVSVVHVSTGATGNTPVGRWRIYRLGPGWNASRMYYSLYFLRGFAIHGYPSVPAWPASHGCVRTPTWFAPGFFSRWGRLGTTVVVFP